MWWLLYPSESVFAFGNILELRFLLGHGHEPRGAPPSLQARRFHSLGSAFDGFLKSSKLLDRCPAGNRMASSCSIGDGFWSFRWSDLAAKPFSSPFPARSNAFTPSLYLAGLSPLIFTWNFIHLTLAPAAGHSGFEDHFQADQVNRPPYLCIPSCLSTVSLCVYQTCVRVELPRRPARGGRTTFGRNRRQDLSNNMRVFIDILVLRVFCRHSIHIEAPC